MSFPLRTLLFISLAANLLIIGAVVGAKFAGVRLERGPPPANVVERLPGPRAFMEALPPETRAKLRDDFIESAQQTRELRQAARQARIDAFQAARTEPYDAERVRQAFARMREADQAVAAGFQDRVAQSFATLTPEERARALDALRDAQPGPRGAGGPFRQRRQGPDGPPPPPAQP